MFTLNDDHAWKTKINFVLTPITMVSRHLGNAHLANGHLVNGHLANGHLANKCMGTFGQQTKCLISITVLFSSITEYPVSKGQFLMETLQKCGRKAKRNLAKIVCWPNVPPCTYWPNVRWPSVRWPNVRWPSVRWPNGRWSNVPDSKTICACKYLFPSWNLKFWLSKRLRIYTYII